MKKKTVKKDTFKMQNGGRVVEMHNSHKANIQHLIDNDGDVDAYIMKYGGKSPKAAIGTMVGLVPNPDDVNDPRNIGVTSLRGGDASTDINWAADKQFASSPAGFTNPNNISINPQAALAGQDLSQFSQEIQQFDQLGQPLSAMPTQKMSKKGKPVGQNFSQPTFNQQGQQFGEGNKWGTPPKRDTNLGAVPLPYYASKIKSFGEDRAYAQKILANNPSPWDEKAAKRAVGMDTAGMVAAGVGQGLQDIQKTLSPISGAIGSMNALRDRQMVNASKKKDAADVNTYAGSDSGLKMSKHGSKVAGANMGGYDDPRNVGDTQLRDSRDFNAENNDGEANVNTQAGEAYADVATGSVGPILDSDGGMTGDQHGPEGTGGIDQVFSPGSGIITKEHTKSVGAMLEAFQNFPEIQKRIIGMGKTEMTDADLALQYATKPLEKQQMVILKDRVKIGKDQVKEKDKRDWGVDLPAARTRELNLQTLSSMEEKKKEEHDKLDQEIAYNNAIVRGPIYDNMRQGQREGLHGKALAEKVKKEDSEFRMKSEFGNRLPIADGGVTVPWAITPGGLNNIAPVPPINTTPAGTSNTSPLVIDDIISHKDKGFIHSKTGLPATTAEVVAMEKVAAKSSKKAAKVAPKQVVHPIAYNNANQPGGTPIMSYDKNLPQGAAFIDNNYYGNVKGETAPRFVRGVDTENNYSQVPNQYSGKAPIDYTNLRKTFQQFGERGEVQPGYYEEIASQLEKEDRELNAVMKNASVYGQHKGDKLYGAVQETDILNLENSPGFEFMKTIAKKHNMLHFFPDETTDEGQQMIEEFEKAVNAADKANGATPHFTADKIQPFGEKKFGNWHMSYSPWVHKSQTTGPALDAKGNPVPQTTYDPSMPIIYKNTNTATPAVTPPPATPPTLPPTKITQPGRRPYYSEGLNPWQTAGEFAAMLDPYEAAPYIEDKGASNALAASTRGRYMDIQPQLNRLTRGTKAQTRLAGASPIDQARNAQAYANEYEAAGQAYGQKYNADAQIDQNFNNTQNELMMRAGANKAAALNLLADRSAKGHSAFEDRWINAISGIGTKKVAQQAENRASILYQDMFPGYGYNGQYTTNRNGNPNLKIGYTPTGDKLTGSYADQKYALKLKQLELERDEDAAQEYAKSTKAPKQKYGGKAKLPKKSPKRK